MDTIMQAEVLAKLPQIELEESLSDFLRPVTELLPDEHIYNEGVSTNCCWKKYGRKSRVDAA